MKNPNDLFENLFVLEIANNHWGDVDRGLRIIREYGEVVRKNNIKAAIKLQLRDIESFIHDQFLDTEVQEGDKEVVNAPGTNSRYIKKTLTTKLTKEEFQRLVDETRKQGMITMATPFDEKSVDLCEELGIDILKIASQDARAFTLIERMIETKKPTIISNGGTGVKDLDTVVDMYQKAHVPLAINHCVSLYPSEDNELEMNQIDFLRKRYPKHVIGFSTHEYHDWANSTLIAYAKGARTFERHVDIDANDIPVSKYCSLPHQADIWFKAFHKAIEMCGPEEGEAAGRNIPQKEEEYIRSVSRGVYALRDLPRGYVITREKLDTDYYLAIPLREGQISSRELDDDLVVPSYIKKGAAIFRGSDAGIFANVRWPLFAVTEGTSKAATIGLLKYLSTLLTLPLVAVSTFVIGVIQLIAGFVMVRYRKFDIYPHTPAVIGSSIVGIVSLYIFGLTLWLFLTTAIPFLTLVFMHLLGPLAVAIYDRAITPRRLRAGHIVSPLVIILALGIISPTLILTEIPMWFGLVLTLPAIHVLGEVVSRSVGTARPISAWVHNFWSGLSMSVGSLFMIALLAVTGDLVIPQMITEYWTLTIMSLIGVITLISLFSKQKTLQTGGSIAVKRGLVYGVWALLLILLGAISFGISAPTVVAVVLLLVSYAALLEKINLRSVAIQKGK